MLRRLGAGAGAGHRGSSWYWRPRLSPQKLKMLDTPEKAPGARKLGEEGQDRRHAPPLPLSALALPDSGLQVSLLFSQTSVRGSPPGSSPGGLGLEKGTRRRGLELRPGPSSSLLSGLEGPLDRLSPHGPPGRPRPLGAAPTRPGPKADTSPGCSGSVRNRERASERAGGMEEIRVEKQERGSGGRGGAGGLEQAQKRAVAGHPGVSSPGNRPKSSPAAGCLRWAAATLGGPLWAPRPAAQVLPPCSPLSCLFSPRQFKAASTQPPALGEPKKLRHAPAVRASWRTSWRR